MAARCNPRVTRKGDTVAQPNDLLVLDSGRAERIGSLHALRADGQFYSLPSWVRR